MKIGVMTIPFNNNYGGYLQAFALITTLKSLGHDAVLINRMPQNWPLFRRVRYFIKSLIKVILLRKCDSLFLSKERSIQRKGRLMLKFVDSYIPKTKPVRSSRELSKLTKSSFDVVVFGSDQLWRPDYVPNITDFFGAFLKRRNVCRIAYAASFGNGNPQYTEKERVQCGKEISKFRSISLRESSGLDVIKKMKWKTVRPEIVLDPTMLLDVECYNSKMFEKKSESVSKLFCYVLDSSNEAEKIIKRVSEVSDLDVYNIIDSKLWKCADYLLPPIEDWICGIRDAAFVITDSYHGTVFSILFNKPFAVCVNKKRGADRFFSLLEQFGLMDRIVCSEGDAERVWKKKIDWIAVNEAIQIKRKASLDFLKNALNICESGAV